MALNHGGDWAGYQDRYGRMPLDFSASTTPLPMPDGMRSALAQSFSMADRYPDPRCTALTAALAEKHGVPESCILCGAGAADLLFRLAFACGARQALITAPTFGGYEEALEAAGCRTERLRLLEAEDFELTDGILQRIRPGLDALFLCSPNNPTGRTVKPALLTEILERCEQQGTLLVLDECFNEFLDDPDRFSLMRKVTGWKNLLILRSFTKWFPMAGLRLGYAVCADGLLLEKMRRFGQPWPVSSPAQAAGLAALKEDRYEAALSRLICLQRPALQAGLERLGFRVIPGEANYLLLQTSCADLGERLEKRGILIRSCAEFAGLEPGWFRVAVRSEPDNRQLLEAMEEVL